MLFWENLYDVCFCCVLGFDCVCCCVCVVIGVGLYLFGVFG